VREKAAADQTFVTTAASIVPTVLQAVKVRFVTVIFPKDVKKTLVSDQIQSL
jgi:hypothetical protein